MSPALGPGPEFDRIRAIAEALGNRASGLGDDCSFIPAGSGFFAVSTDLSVEGVHFRKEWLTPEEIGWRAAAGALSDLAAVGATPVGILTSVAVPPETQRAELVALMEGMARASEAAGGMILGGDLARSATLTIDVTVIGKTDAPVRRSGAQPGDGIWVTGTLGRSRAALKAWQRGESPEPSHRNAFAHPLPRIVAGRWLAQRGAHAMIDLSDGLAGDAGHLAAASGVALAIDLELVPLGTGVDHAASQAGESPLHFAARGGEDYELLVALSPQFTSVDAGRFQGDVGIGLTRIGMVNAGSGTSLTQSGRSVSLSGYDHFS